MKKLKIVIISRHIFPKISPRAFRATELAKEMVRKGHTVVLYAVLGNYDYTEFQKNTGISVKNIGKMFTGSEDSNANFRYTFFDKILFHALHKLIEYPDIEFLFKVFSIIKKESKCDMLITIAYPHPIHWGASLAKSILSKEKFPKNWISDCGDPYMGNPIENNKMFYFKYVEKWWCKKTDFITIPIEEGRKGYYPEFISKIKIIPQGVDFTSIKLDENFKKNQVPTFAYAGNIYPGLRDPTEFLNYISGLEKEFKFIVYTNNQNFYLQFKQILKEKFEIKSYVPREQLIYELSQMDFLINLKNSSSIQAPSKIIDYLLTKRPILDVSTNFLELILFNEFLDGNYKNQKKIQDISQFNITNVVDKFIELYKE